MRIREAPAGLPEASRRHSAAAVGEEQLVLLGLGDFSTKFRHIAPRPQKFKESPNPTRTTCCLPNGAQLCFPCFRFRFRVH